MTRKWWHVYTLVLRVVFLYSRIGRIVDYQFALMSVESSCTTYLTDWMLLFCHFRPDMYRELMQSILTYDWNSEKIVSIAFANLLSHIISSNVTFLLPILSMLVRTFTYSAPTADAGATSEAYFVCISITLISLILRTVNSLFHTNRT